MKYIGIDIGAKGGLAIINNDDVFLQQFNEKKYIDILSSLEPKEVIICIEKVHSMPKQGVVSMFTFGSKYGWIIGVLNTLGLYYFEVSPQRWMNSLKIRDKSKKGIHNNIISVYPQIRNSLLGSRGGIKDGLSDALSIAHFCKLLKG